LSNAPLPVIEKKRKKEKRKRRQGIIKCSSPCHRKKKGKKKKGREDKVLSNAPLPVTEKEKRRRRQGIFKCSSPCHRKQIMCSSRVSAHFCTADSIQMSSPLFGRRQLQKKKLFLTPDSIQMSSPWSNESQEYEDADDPGNMKSADFF